MKMGIVIILVIVAMVAGAGGAIALKMGGKGDSGGGKKEHKEKLPTQILSLDERTVNLADIKVPHYLRLTVALEVAGKGKAEELEAEWKPKLLDCLISVVSKHSFNHLLSPEGKIKLKEELAKGFAEELKESTWEVKDVLFTDFVME